MTIEQTEVASPEATQERAQPAFAAVDLFLQNLVDSVNQYESEFAVTLQVSGLLVTGTLIASAIYFEEFSKLFAQGANDVESARAPILAIAKSARQSMTDPLVPLPQFIHLRGARFYDAAGNSLPGSEEGLLWRGRLTEVHGFFWGKLERQSPQQ
jgi:hypothetical protein